MKLGVRTHRDLDLGRLTAIDGQANYYHVDFHNRLFNVAPFNLFNPAALRAGQCGRRDHGRRGCGRHLAIWRALPVLRRDLLQQLGL